MTNQPTYPADLSSPKMVEIVTWQIASTDANYDISWIEGELLLRCNCEDGIVLVYYLKGKE